MCSHNLFFFLFFLCSSSLQASPHHSPFIIPTTTLLYACVQHLTCTPPFPTNPKPSPITCNHPFPHTTTFALLHTPPQRRELKKGATHTRVVIDFGLSILDSLSTSVSPDQIHFPVFCVSSECFNINFLYYPRSGPSCHSLFFVT